MPLAGRFLDAVGGFAKLLLDTRGRYPKPASNVVTA